MSFAAAMLIALLIDAVLGWPNAVFLRIGHPVTWLGRLISALDARLNRDDQSDTRRRAKGCIAALIVIAAATLPALALQIWLPNTWATTLLVGILAWPFVAVRSMYQHVVAVADPLSKGALNDARHAVAMIVGRDPAQLDAAGIARAATESLAENTGDGIIAPLFWGLVAGLPGIAAYKAINTLDSMIGHRSPRHEAFGWASAKIDDVANWVPARLTGLIFALASYRLAASVQCMLRDAHLHRSPNAGWPEAAMAGALGVRLSGPRIYGDHVAPEPWVNPKAPDPTAADLRRALALYCRAMFGVVGVLAIFAWGLEW